jgi:small subunit ribosomal protein S20
MKSAVKQLETAIEERQGKETLDALYKTATSIIDRVAGKGVIKNATASRKISRLGKAVNKTASAPTKTTAKKTTAKKKTAKKKTAKK